MRVRVVRLVVDPLPAELGAPVLQLVVPEGQRVPRKRRRHQNLVEVQTICTIPENTKIFALLSSDYVKFREIPQNSEKNQLRFGRKKQVAI